MSQALQPNNAVTALRNSTELAINQKTAAAALGVDPRTVSAAIASGTIPAVKLGRRVLIPREKFLALFEVNTNE